MSVVCCASTSWAQHKTTVPVSKLDSMQYLENVVVYAKKPYQEVIPAQTLSGKRLEGLNSHSVADAIRYFSGVQIKDYGGVGGVKTVDIRSMGTNHMGVFYDGIQLGNARMVKSTSESFRSTTLTRFRSTMVRKARYSSLRAISAQPAPSISAPITHDSRKERTTISTSRSAQARLDLPTPQSAGSIASRPA